MVGITALTFSVGYLLFLPLASFFVQVILLLTLAILSIAYLPLLSVFFTFLRYLYFYIYFPNDFLDIQYAS